jgi:hypothetical protein
VFVDENFYFGDVMLTAVWMALSFRMLHPFLNMGLNEASLPGKGVSETIALFSRSVASSSCGQ